MQNVFKKMTAPRKKPAVVGWLLAKVGNPLEDIMLFARLKGDQQIQYRAGMNNQHGWEIYCGSCTTEEKLTNRTYRPETKVEIEEISETEAMMILMVG